MLFENMSIFSKYKGTMIIVLSLSILGVVQSETIARMIKTKGEVMIKRLGRSGYDKVAKPGTEINNGDACEVGSQEFAAAIYLDDRSIVKIKENTRFQFIDTPNTRTVNIELGTILNDIKTQKKSKAFRIETPVSVASVKGTKFAVVVNPSGVDQFYGMEGIVEVMNLVTGKTVSLTPGTKVISDIAGNIIQAPATPNEYPEDPDPEVEEPPREEEIKEDIKEEPKKVEKKQIEQEPAPEPEEEIKEIEEQPIEDSPVEPSEPEEEILEKAPSGKSFGMGLSIGSATIDGTMYNQFSLRPEFSFGKVGIGLDLGFYIDNEGNILKDTWDIDQDPALILDKFLFIRWGKETDPFWIKWGSLENVTLGYGGLVNGYSNMMEFPSVRRVGINSGFNLSGFTGNIFVANLKDFSRGGSLIGIRGSYTLSKTFPLKLGFNVVTDMNQFAGLTDKDDDTYPDVFDDFPEDSTLWNDTDGDGIPDPHSGIDSSMWDIDADGNNISDDDESDLSLKQTPFSIEGKQAAATGFSFDIGYPILKTKIMTVEIYTEYSMLDFPAVNDEQFTRPNRKGTGITIPGVRANLFKFLNLSLEFRIKEDYFLPQFFDQAYDLNRVVPDFSGDTTTVFTKDMISFNSPNSDVSTNGLFGSAGFNLFNFATFDASYTSMKADTTEFNSFNAVLALNTENIPKFSVASAYYQHNNDKDPFKIESENTVFGYRIGWEVSKGVSLIWDYRQFYRDTGIGLEPVKQTSIETAFSF